MILAGIVVVVCANQASAAADWEESPIRYSKTAPTDEAADLAKKLENGQITLQKTDRLGYLPALLRELKLSADSQTLVFSKTSFQRTIISPRNPRALYFNDEVYVGDVHGGDVLEVAAMDVNTGVNFYTLDQRAASARLVRQTDSCLQCHAGSMTKDIPGLLIRSVFPDSNGQPILSAGTFFSTDQTPLHDRWGGWFVTGNTGKQKHMGNAFLKGTDDPHKLDRASGQNLLDLSRFFNACDYLRGTSDVAALMMLEHQVGFHNRLIRANFETRAAIQAEQATNKALGRPAEFRSETTESRIRSACEPLVQYMLFCGEAKLDAPFKGTSGFAEEYSQRGPRDSKGRSLRQLDLNHRLLKYPCSPLIYSRSFADLPEPAKSFVERRLWEVLTGRDYDPPFDHLADADRDAIYDILQDTMSDLPSYWKPRK